MSEKYFTIGAPMSALPRPVTTFSSSSSGYCSINGGSNSANPSRSGLAALGGDQDHDIGGGGGGGGGFRVAAAVPLSAPTVRFHDCSLIATDALTADLTRLSDPKGSLHICNLSKDDVTAAGNSSKEISAKFSSGVHVTCPALGCSVKNSQFQQAGRFPPEFLLGHLHGSHRHRRFNGDALQLTVVVPQLDRVTPTTPAGAVVAAAQSASSSRRSQHQQHLLQTWPFVEVICFKRHFYLEAQAHCLDGLHSELFLWLWFLGPESEECHYRYHLMVLHGKSEYSYRGNVISMTKTATDVREEGRCLVIRERVWDYVGYKLRITKH